MAELFILYDRMMLKMMGGRRDLQLNTDFIQWWMALCSSHSKVVVISEV
jgi:hypothetical protein